MLRSPSCNTDIPRRVRQPAWIGYAVTLVLEALVTVVLSSLSPFLPPYRFPIAYVLAIMLVAYYYGEGPAAVAFLVGLFLFLYLFIPPEDQFWPPANSAEGWEGIIDFLVGTLIVGVAAVLMGRSRRRLRATGASLEEQRALLDTFMQNVPVGLGFHDCETRHLIANRMLAEMSRTSMAELIGKTVWEALPPDLAANAALAIENVFRTGQPSRWRDLETEFDGVRHYNVQHLPVRNSDGTIIGVGVVVVDTTEQVLARRELEQIYEHEHRIAETLQASLLSEIPRKIAGFEFETLYRAALEEARVGGDFYDVFRISDGKMGIVVGDVSGKGLKAAAQVALARSAIRASAYDHEEPAAVMERVNRLLNREMDAEGFVTIFFGVLDCATRGLTYVNGGHSPAIYWEAASGRAELLGPTGLLVGTIEDATYEERTILFELGDELLLGTDGLFEIGCGAELLSPERLCDLYAEMKRSGTMSAAGLADSVEALCQSTFRDDVAILRVCRAE